MDVSYSHSVNVFKPMLLVAEGINKLLSIVQFLFEHLLDLKMSFLFDSRQFDIYIYGHISLFTQSNKTLKSSVCCKQLSNEYTARLIS